MCLLCVQKAIVTESCMVSVYLSNSKFELVDKGKGKRTAHIKHLLYTRYFVRCCTYAFFFILITSLKQMLTQGLTVRVKLRKLMYFVQSHTAG